MKRYSVSLNFVQEIEFEDNENPTEEDIKTAFKEQMGDFETHGGGLDSLIKIEPVNEESGIPITLEELAEEVVLPEMLVYHGDKLDLDFIVEKAHHTDHRANKENVREALQHLEESGDVIKSHLLGNWIAIRH